MEPPKPKKKKHYLQKPRLCGCGKHMIRRPFVHQCIWCQKAARRGKRERMHTKQTLKPYYEAVIDAMRQQP